MNNTINLLRKHLEDMNLKVQSITYEELIGYGFERGYGWIAHLYSNPTISSPKVWDGHKVKYNVI